MKLLVLLTHGGYVTGFSHIRQWYLVELYSMADGQPAGGESNLNPVKGVYNEDELFAELVGWHLQGLTKHENQLHRG
jgi:hypothetical protein